MINDRYIVRRIAGTGRSTVYLCEDTEANMEKVALKVLPPDTAHEEIEVFRKEFFVLQRFNHPNIIKVLDFGKIVKNTSEWNKIQEGSYFISLEYFDGKILSLDYAPQEEHTIKLIIKEIVSVLFYLHQSNYIYNDLKPENILVAKNGEAVSIKFIDFGFITHAENKNAVIRGSAEYLAPEVLKKESYDHRIDLYSLGILLYKIVYKVFPFDNTDEVEVFKSHINGNFEYSTTLFSQELVSVIKKLTSKEPSERYDSALLILKDLDIDIDKGLTKNLLPATARTGRKDLLAIAKTYLQSSGDGEILVIKGFGGSGRTTLSKEIYEDNPHLIYVESIQNRTGYAYLKHFLTKILYHETVYSKISFELRSRIADVLKSPSEEILGSIKSILTQVSYEANFKLLLENFNLYDDLLIEVFKDIIPVFQVNNIRIILTENSDIDYKSNFIHNLREINLTPYTESQLFEFIEYNFHAYFPKEELKKLILLYSDLMPGSIQNFINDLVLLGMLVYSYEGVKLVIDKDKTDILKNSNEELYKMRLKTISKEELFTAQIISAFSVSISIDMLQNISGYELTNYYVNGLQNANILLKQTGNVVPSIISNGLKSYIYSTIPDKKAFHLLIANLLADNYQNFNKIEIARHFELGEDYLESYKIVKEELLEAERLGAYSYQRKLLEHIISFPLDRSEKIEIKLQLSNTIYHLGDPRTVLTIIDDLLKEELTIRKKEELLILKGICLIESGEIEKGKLLLEEQLKSDIEKHQKLKLLIEIAVAELDLNNYNSVINICNKVIADNDSTLEEKGRCFNLLGLVEIHLDNNLDNALKYFINAERTYNDAGLKLKSAQTSINIGNLYNIKGDYVKAESSWNKFLEVSSVLGNLDLEAKLLNNFGIYYFNNLNIEKALESNKRALTIFNSIGNLSEQGYVNINMGEICLMICEYNDSLVYLENARSIFSRLQSVNEELEAIFLLGKLFNSVGDMGRFITILDLFKEGTLKESVVIKHINNLNYLNLVNSVDSIPATELLEELKIIKEIFYQGEDKNNYFSSHSFMILYLLENKYTEKAFIELNEIRFAKLCQENIIYAAQRNYLIGKIAQKDIMPGLKAPLDYFLEAIDLLKDFNVTELTWKILYEIALMYNERGNAGKAEEYKKYASGLINMLGNNINDMKMREAYFNKAERKEALKKLAEIKAI